MTPFNTLTPSCLIFLFSSIQPPLYSLVSATTSTTSTVFILPTISFSPNNNNNTPPSTSPTTSKMKTFASTLNSINKLNKNTINNLNNTTKKRYTPHYSVRVIWLIFGPIIFVVGLLGNSFVLLIMNKKIMAGTSTCVHLSAMAGADMVVMVVGLIPEWFENCFDLAFKDINPWTCKLEKFFFYSAADVSVWILVVFSLDRYVAIRHPLKRRAICTKRRARMFSAGVLALALVKNLHVFWTRGVQLKWSEKVGGFVVKKKCGTSHPAYLMFEEAVRPWLIFVLINCLPAIIIVICNVFIIKAMFKMKNSPIPLQSFSTKRKSSSIVQASNVHHSSSTPSFDIRRHSTDLVCTTQKLSQQSALLGRKSLCSSPISLVIKDTSSNFQSINNRSFLQMAAMCCSASVCFLVCNTPSVVLYVGRRHWKHHPSYLASKPIWNIFVYLHHAINFLLYCIAGQRFRNMFADYLCCRYPNHPPSREASKRRYSDWSDQSVLTPARLRRLEHLASAQMYADKHNINKKKKQRGTSPHKETLHSINESF